MENENFRKQGAASAPYEEKLEILQRNRELEVENRKLQSQIQGMSLKLFITGIEAEDFFERQEFFMQLLACEDNPKKIRRMFSVWHQQGKRRNHRHYNNYLHRIFLDGYYADDKQNLYGFVEELWRGGDIYGRKYYD